jgi:hypothetical protein
MGVFNIASQFGATVYQSVDDKLIHGLRRLNRRSTAKTTPTIPKLTTTGHAERKSIALAKAPITFDS